MMQNKAPIHVLMLFVSFFLVELNVSHAQDCEISQEEIVTLKPPVFSTPTVWNAFYGEDGLEQFSDLALGAEDTYVMIGSYTQNEEDNVYKPFITKLDNRGRIIWENKEKVGFSKTAKKIHKRKSGYAVIGDIKSSKGSDGFYLAFYSEDGKRIKQFPVFEAGYKLNIHDFAPSKTEKSYILSVTRQAVQKADADEDEVPKTEVVLYKITTEGKRLWRRQYSPGLSTALYSIDLAEDGNYTLGGEIEIENRRMAGWLVRVDEDGALMWQRPYPRGAMATIRDAYTHEDLSITIAGQVRGIGEREKSGWAMNVSLDGTTVWQRYYTGDYDYNAPSIIGYKDGRVSVLLDAKSKGFNEEIIIRSHANLLTISPRGYLMNLESYTDGQNTNANMMVSGHYGERMVVGVAQIAMPDDMNPNNPFPYIFDGWIFAATGLDPYVDPCETFF